MDHTHVHSDGVLSTAVLKELTAEMGLPASRIVVGAADGVVELRGSVASIFDALAAQRIALSVDGAAAVANEISVAVPSELGASDREIAGAVSAAIGWAESLPSSDISVAVSHGIVTLAGHVESASQREEAATIANRTVGVRGLENRIGLVRAPVEADIVSRIHRSLLDRAARTAADIRVEITVGGAITLRGEVLSWPDKADAGHAAWSTPFVTDVLNLIRVRG